MAIENTLLQFITEVPAGESLWDGQYKIPWDEPEFSRRMLREHLSQEHDLASRRTASIAAQAAWIDDAICGGRPRRLLDLGCGPGLYIGEFLDRGYDCCGVDFSPASIAHARMAAGKRVRLIQGDVRSVDFGAGFELAMMIYGEFNVFSPTESRGILRRMHTALVPGGKILLEVHSEEAVRRIGQAPASWYKAEAGLFSDQPHICIIENRWYEKQRAALQQFVVIEAASGGVAVYRSTTRAWNDEEYRGLLTTAGFSVVTRQDDWPSGNSDLLLYSAVRPAE